MAGGLLLFESKTARTRAITKLTKEGSNYFVCYKKGKLFAVQHTKAKKAYVNKFGKNGVYVEGMK